MSTFGKHTIPPSRLRRATPLYTRGALRLVGSSRKYREDCHTAVPNGAPIPDQPGTHRLRRPAARLLTNLSNFVFNSVICCSKPPSILKTRKVAEAVSRLLSNSVESSFLPLFFPNPKRKPPMVRPSGVFPHLLPNYVVPP